MTLLTLEHVTRRFGGLVAVNDVDLKVEPGAVTAIIGPNGAGKTTLFHLVSGFQTPDDGRITFEGNDITGSRREDRPRAGADVSAGATVPRHGIESSRSAVTCTRGGVLRADRRRARQTEARSRRRRASFWDLSARGHATCRPPCPMASSGLEIARALAAKPKLLLPTSRRRANSQIAAVGDHPQHRGASTTVLLIEHDMNLVMSTADTVAVLDFGRKIAEDTPASVRENPAVIAAYLGTTEAAHA